MIDADLRLDYTDVVWNTAAHPTPPDVVLGAYRRASTHGQRTGWRFQETFQELIQLALRLGPEYGVVLFDEGAQSGSSIARRHQMPILINYLRAGLLQGIVTTDLGRLTRDKTLTDGLAIARVLQERRGILVTRGRVWDLGNQGDYADYCEELLASAKEVSVIRDRLYAGQENRAVAVMRGEAPPMFRGRPPVGYKSAVCYRSHDSSRRWETDPARGQDPIVHRGVVIRTWIKCPESASTVEALHEELVRNDDLSTVAKAMNQRHIGAPWTLRDSTCYWGAKLIRQILKHPIYWGYWKWIYSPRDDTSLWNEYDPTKYERDFPELAYWTQEEAIQFEDVFLRPGRPPRPSREHDHLAVGLVACAVCHETLVGAGRDYSVKQDGRIYSPTRLRCPRCGRLSSEDGLLRALDQYFPEVIGRINDLPGRIRRGLAHCGEDALRERIDAIDRRQAILALRNPSGRDRSLEGEMSMLARKRSLLVREIGAASSRRDLEHLAELSGVFSSDPLRAYSELTPREKAALWRIILQDDGGNVVPLEMTRMKKGNSQNSPGRWAMVTANSSSPRS